MMTLIRNIVMTLLLVGVMTATAQAGCLSISASRTAVSQGQALPLSRIAVQVRREGLGQILRAKLCKNGSRYVYRLTILSGNGVVRNLTVDAASGSY